MQTDSFPTAISDRTRLNVILAYNTMPSALWAADTLMGLLRKEWGKPELTLSPWSFEVIATPEWSHLATVDALKVDMIVLTISDDIPDLPPMIGCWLERCLHQEFRTERPAVIAFFRTRGVLDHEDSPRLQEVQRLAEENACAFFAPHCLAESPG